MEHRNFILELVELYHSFPSLWNSNSKDYKDRNLKQNNYETLLTKYKEHYPDATKRDLTKKLNSLRTCYRRELKRIAALERNGIGVNENNEPTLFYFEAMSFLRDCEPPSSSRDTTNQTSEESETEEIEMPMKRRKTSSSEKKLLAVAAKRLMQPKDEFWKLGETWANELKNMDEAQQVFAKKFINEILFEGQMGTLHRNAMSLNVFSGGPIIKQNQVDVLFDGYSYYDREDSNYMRANCTSTLIRTRNGVNIIVDTMTSWDGERIAEALEKFGLKPGNIHTVVGTHGHSDHIGCHYLFPEARWHFVGASASTRDKYLLDWSTFGGKCDGDKISRFELDGRDVVVERTPGHTLGCVSVIVRETNLGGTVAICGDLFEKEEDILNPALWIAAGSENIKSQYEQRFRIAKMCDYIIPGHGHGFAVTDVMRNMLQEQLDISKTKEEEN